MVYIFSVAVFLILKVCLFSDAGCPKSPVEGSCSENDDGSDLGSVHLHLQGPHPVPPQLQAHMSTSVCPAQVITDDCGMELQVYAKPHCDDAAVQCSGQYLVVLNQSGLKEWCDMMQEKEVMSHDGAQRLVTSL